MFGMGGHFSQRLPGRAGTGVGGCFHMHAQKCALGEDTCGEAVPLQRRKPPMHAVVMHVGIHPERHQHIAIQQPSHSSSSSTSICRTVSAVMGCLPLEITKPLRFGEGERRELSFVPPGKERRNKRLTAALIVQSSALASDFARA